MHFIQFGSLKTITFSTADLFIPALVAKAGDPSRFSEHDQQQSV